MTRAVEIRAPSGETEGTRSQILRWLKRLGERVAENEPLIEIETDKVTVELASPGSGVLRTAPHVTTVFEADLAAVLADRSRRREEFARRGVPLTLTAYFVQAAVAAIRAVPEANSRWTDTALEIHEPIHIGVATAVEGTGLLVPGLRAAGSRGLLDTALGLNDLVTRARAGELSPADLQGGTFTISNHGVSGSLLAAPIIINPPQSAILGAGEPEKRPVVVDEGDWEKIVAPPRCYVTLRLDHRVTDD